MGDGHNYGQGKCPRCGEKCGYEDGVPDCSCPDPERYCYCVCEDCGRWDVCAACEVGKPHEKCRGRHVCPESQEVVYCAACNENGDLWEG
jgi:hypothetical protein